MGLTIESCAAPAVNLFTVVMAASLIPPRPSDSTEQLHKAQQPPRSEPSAGDSVSGEEGCAQDDMAEPQQLPMVRVDHSARPKVVVDIRLGLIFSLLRLVIIPTLGLSAQYAIVRIGFMPFDKLGLLVCYLEMVVPSAQMGIVVLQQLGCSSMASKLAQLVAMQYVLAAFTLTGFTALVIYLVEQQFQ